MKTENKILNVRGVYDYSSKEQRVRNYIEDTLRETFECYGYEPLETSILCYYELLALKYDEDNEILNEIYKLKDQGNRNLGLRYDLTVPFAKFIALNKGIRLPYKRYEIGKVFRNGPIKKGRDREFIQCDVDVVGLGGQMIEAEIISLLLDGYSRLKIDAYVKYNNRNLLIGLLTEFNVESEKMNRAISIIDKYEKVSKDDLVEMFIELGVNKEDAISIIDTLSLSLDELKEKYENGNEIIKKGLYELDELATYLKELGINEEAKFTPTLARGQEYYTGNVFEAYLKDNKLTSSIGGGGRYDNMVTDWVNDGNEYPAVGVSFGLSSIYEYIKDREEFSETSNIQIYIIPLNTQKESLKLAYELRKMGYKVDLEMNNRKLKKSLDFASKEKINYVIILGEDEIKNNKFKLKDMNTGTEYNVNIDELTKIREIIK